MNEFIFLFVFSCFISYVVRLSFCVFSLVISVYSLLVTACRMFAFSLGLSWFIAVSASIASVWIQSLR
jgi:hypothetical protein